MVDILPEQTQLWQAVEFAASDHFHRAGFKEIRTPLLEVTDLFGRSVLTGLYRQEYTKLLNIIRWMINYEKNRKLAIE